MMDRRKTDAECGGGGVGGRVVHRHNRTSTLTVVVVLQNLLVAACLVVTLYVYWEVYQVPVSTLRRGWGGMRTVTVTSISSLQHVIMCTEISGVMFHSFQYIVY